MCARDFRNIMHNRRSSRQNNDVPVQNYADILRNTRENHGISIHEVATELHVREDIIEAIEDADFSKIPPQGYSRNMIKSYARLLGLNPNEMTNMFLDSEYSYRIGKQRASIQQISDENKKRVPNVIQNRFKTPREQLEDKASSNRETRRETSRNTNSPFGNRRVQSFESQYQNTPRSRKDQQEELRRGGRALRSNPGFGNDDDYDNARRRLEARMQGNVQQNQPQKSSALKQRTVIGRQDRRTQQNNAPASYQFMNVYNAGKSGVKQVNFKLPLIIAIVTILVIALVVFLFLMGKHQENQKTDVSNIQVTGLTDPDKGNQNDLTPPTEAKLVYKVKNGKTASIQIYESGQSKPSFSKNAKSGETDTVTLTKDCKITTNNPDNVAFTIDGKIIEPTFTGTKGVYTYDFSMQEFQQEWKTNRR